MENIKEIYEMLNWKNPVETQLKGIELAKKVVDLNLLIWPPSVPAVPSVHEHCANILSEKSDEILEPYLDSLLEWLQDLNWPGGLTIFERLKIFSASLLKPHLEKAVYAALEINDYSGLKWLKNMCELLANKDLKNELSEDVLKIFEINGEWFWD